MRSSQIANHGLPAKGAALLWRIRRAIRTRLQKLLGRNPTPEMEFWLSLLKYGDGRPEYVEAARNRLRSRKARKEVFPHEILPHLQQIAGGAYPIRTMEIGPGPLSTLGWGVEEGILDVLAIDPLADEYRRIVNYIQNPYPIVPLRADGEDATLIFQGLHFHLAYARNSIDHCREPQKVFGNMVTLLVHGGILAHKHGEREGTLQRWKGGHNWDLSLDGNDIILSDSRGAEVNLCRANPLTPIKVWQETSEGRSFICGIYRKEQTSP